ncbi:MAG: hypothetical protein WKF73_07460 [Nocardioidaceae bacterium]
MMDFGYRTLILGDPKDEYEKLCRAFGVEPFAIGHGLPLENQPAGVRPPRPGLAPDLDAAAGPSAGPPSCSAAG